ncbi:MAG: hypothetical protein EZS28_044142, partial [Streblomastix strix]
SPQYSIVKSINLSYPSGAYGEANRNARLKRLGKQKYRSSDSAILAQALYKRKMNGDGDRYGQIGDAYNLDGVLAGGFQGISSEPEALFTYPTFDRVPIVTINQDADELARLKKEEDAIVERMRVVKDIDNITKQSQEDDENGIFLKQKGHLAVKRLESNAVMLMKEKGKNQWIKFIGE